MTEVHDLRAHGATHEHAALADTLGITASVRNHMISKPKILTWMRRTSASAAAFVLLGAKLAFTDR